MKEYENVSKEILEEEFTRELWEGFPENLIHDARIHICIRKAEERIIEKDGFITVYPPIENGGAL